MEYLEKINETLLSLPAWCIVLPPAVLLVSFVPLRIFGRRGLYLWLSGLSLVAEGLFSAGTGHVPLCLALHAALALLPYPLFSVRFRLRRKGREEKLFGKFREEIAQPFPERHDPPKVCCFEQPKGETAEERGMQLSHVVSLLDKLKREKLSPADRLEVEMLSRTVEGSRDRPLSDRQTDDLSDDLSAVLRLVAKYS